MPWHPDREIGGGVQPTPNALYYKKPGGEAGMTEYATVPSYRVDEHGRYWAWVHHSKYGLELMTEKEGRLDGFTPVVALVEEDMARIVEEATEAVRLEFGTKIDALLAKVARLEEATPSATAGEDCPQCNFVAKNKTGLAAHIRRRHAIDAD